MCICAFKVLNFMTQLDGHACQHQKIIGWTTENYYASIRTSYYNAEGAGKMGKELLDF